MRVIQFIDKDDTVLAELIEVRAAFKELKQRLTKRIVDNGYNEIPTFVWFRDEPSRIYTNTVNMLRRIYEGMIESHSYGAPGTTPEEFYNGWYAKSAAVMLVTIDADKSITIDPVDVPGDWTPTQLLSV